jgi:hypothetical protein
MTIPFQDNDFDMVVIVKNIRDETKKINEKEAWWPDDHNQNVNGVKNDNSFGMIVESVITKGKKMFTKKASFESIKYSIQVTDDNDCYSFDGSFDLYDFTNNYYDYSSSHLDVEIKENATNNQANNNSNQIEEDENKNEESVNFFNSLIDKFNSFLRFYNHSKPF